MIGESWVMAQPRGYRGTMCGTSERFLLIWRQCSGHHMEWTKTLGTLHTNYCDVTSMLDCHTTTWPNIRTITHAHICSMGESFPMRRTYPSEKEFRMCFWTHTNYLNATSCQIIKSGNVRTHDDTTQHMAFWTCIHMQWTQALPYEVHVPPTNKVFADMFSTCNMDW
jgi:hypothetical protein